MKKVKNVIRILVCAMLLFCLAGCGRADGDEEANAGIVPRAEKEEYDLGENKWKGFQETTESREAWAVTDYWDSADLKMTEPGMDRWYRNTAVDGTDYYVLEGFAAVENPIGAGSTKWFLTHIDALTMKAEREELNFLEETAIPDGLAKAIDANRAVICDMDVLDQKLCLLVLQYDEETKELAYAYAVSMDSERKAEWAADLLPALKQAGALEGDFAPQEIWQDREGNIYVKGSEVAVFDRKGEFVALLEIPDGSGLMTGSVCRLPDGRPVFEYMDYESGKTVLYCLESRKKKVLYEGEWEYSNAKHLNRFGEIYSVSGRSLVRWDAAAGKCEELYRDYSMETQFCQAIMESSQGVALLFDDAEIISLCWLKPGITVEEKEIVVFMLSSSQKVEKYADEYSKKHPGIKITVMSKSPEEDNNAAMIRLTAQLAEGEGPDMFMLSRNQLEVLQDKGVLADLSEILPQETLDQMFPAVLQYGMVEGRIYGITISATADALMVPEALWGEDTWTYRDVMKLMESAEASGRGFETFLDNRSADSILFDMVIRDIMGGNSSLVDEEGKKCFFDTEEFIELLEFCKKYSSDHTENRYDMSAEEETEAVRSGRALAYDVDGNLLRYSSQMAALGEGYRCVGYPTDGGYGRFVSCDGCVAINGATEYGETAGDFLRYLLSERVQVKEGITTVRKDILAGCVMEHMGDFEDPVFYGGGRNVVLLPGRADGSSFLPEYLEIMEKGTPAEYWHDEMARIILEEAAAFFQGDKSAAEAARVIQSRMEIYLGEQ